jgi:hypothetical protein
MSLDQMIFLKSLQKPEVADTLLVGPKQPESLLETNSVI